MFRPAQRRRFGWSETERHPLARMGWLTGLLLLAGCATPMTTTAGPPEAARSHIYPLPLDNVFAQTTTLMQKKGWAVKRAGNVLVTNWQGGATETLVSYRIFGQRIAAGLCAMRVERLVATTSTSFNTDHPFTDDDTPTAGRAFAVNQNFVADDLNDSAGGTAPPAGAFSPSDLARPSPWVVSQHRRDVELEAELQREIDPMPVAAAEPKKTEGPRATETLAGSSQVLPAAPATPGPVAPHPEGAASTAPRRPLADLAGIWEGTFNFRGNVTGSFTGEISVAVEDGAVEVADFCPERGGTLTAVGSGQSASWQGELACPPISLKGCTSSVIRYNSANATLQGSKLVLVAAGNVETPAGCGETSGALSTTFIAEKADYVHITVTRAKGGASCAWPSDWEDLGSIGSMAMPESSLEDSAYLGIVRAKGVRLTDIQRLLRHCRHLVLLHGQPVLMHLTATRSHPN
jgi:hypothetical protein